MSLLRQDQKLAALAGEREFPQIRLGGRYWDRTSDLLGVNEALSR